jgi:hypothetical protein
MYVAMAHISIRDLQKMSSETIAKLAGPTPVKSGDVTVAILTPMSKPDIARLRAVVEKAEALAKTRDRKADDEILIAAGADTTDWTIEAVKRFMAEVD